MPSPRLEQRETPNAMPPGVECQGYQLPKLQELNKIEQFQTLVAEGKNFFKAIE